MPLGASWDWALQQVLEDPQTNWQGIAEYAAGQAGTPLPAPAGGDTRLQPATAVTVATIKEEGATVRSERQIQEDARQFDADLAASIEGNNRIANSNIQAAQIAASASKAHAAAGQAAAAASAAASVDAAMIRADAAIKAANIAAQVSRYDTDAKVQIAVMVDKRLLHEFGLNLEFLYEDSARKYQQAIEVAGIYGEAQKAAAAEGRAGDEARARATVDAAMLQAQAAIETANIAAEASRYSDDTKMEMAKMQVKLEREQFAAIELARPGDWAARVGFFRGQTPEQGAALAQTTGGTVFGGQMPSPAEPLAIETATLPSGMQPAPTMGLQPPQAQQAQWLRGQTGAQLPTPTTIVGEGGPELLTETPGGIEISPIQAEQARWLRGQGVPGMQGGGTLQRFRFPSKLPSEGQPYEEEERRRGRPSPTPTPAPLTPTPVATPAPAVTPTPVAAALPDPIQAWEQERAQTWGALGEQVAAQAGQWETMQADAATKAQQWADEWERQRQEAATAEEARRQAQFAQWGEILAQLQQPPAPPVAEPAAPTPAPAAAIPSGVDQLPFLQAARAGGQYPVAPFQEWTGPRTKPEIGITTPVPPPWNYNIVQFQNMARPEQAMLAATWRSMGMIAGQTEEEMLANAYNAMQRSAWRGAALPQTTYGGWSR